MTMYSSGPSFTGVLLMSRMHDRRHPLAGPAPGVRARVGTPLAASPGTGYQFTTAPGRAPHPRWVRIRPGGPAARSPGGVRAG